MSRICKTKRPRGEARSCPPNRHYLSACAETLQVATREPDHVSELDLACFVSLPCRFPLLSHVQQHLGLVRVSQEDAAARHSCGILCDGRKTETNVFVIADGCGGMAGGEVASSICCRAIPKVLLAHGPWTRGGTDKTSDIAGPEAALHAAFDVANSTILDSVSQEPALAGMASTVVVLVIADDGCLWIAWAGDSRAYRLRDGRLNQLTRDHNRVRILVEEGIISLADAQSHPARNQLTNALGMREDVTPDIICDNVRPGDLYLLTTDGFHDGVADSCLLEGCREHLTYPVTGQKLKALGKALEAHVLEDYGQDNLTGLFVYVQPPDDGQTLPGDMTDTEGEPMNQIRERKER